MISCTEFIPAYSELFAYLEDKYGRGEVDRFWEYLFKPDGKGISLINHIKKSGIRGCFTYWSESLNEEAADFTMYLNEKRGYFVIDMHTCPSKGRLLKLKDEIGIVPYHDYCLHCDSYRAAVEKIGLKYIYDFKGIDKAMCSILIYDPNIFDGRVVLDENTEIMERSASDNEYFHRDFHSIMNMGIEYLGSKYGITAVKEYLEIFTNNVYRKEIENIKENGFLAIKDKIKDTYIKEKAEDAVSFDLTDNMLNISVKFCPAVRHLKATGRKVSSWYRYTTEFVMHELAKAGGFTFIMKSYDEENGACEYSFIK